MRKDITSSELERLATLVPSARTALLALRDDCNKAGFDIWFGSCRRTPEHQANLLAMGATATTHSWHVVGRACDVYCYDDDGKLDMAGKDLPRYRWMHRLSMAGGGTGVKGLPFDQTDGNFRRKDGKQVADRGHVEFRDGLTFEQALAQISGSHITQS